MKTGFQVEIQKDLNKKERDSAIRFANGFISNTCANRDLKYWPNTKGGYRSYLRRRRFGFLFDKENKLVFRRILTSKRVFGIVKADTLLDTEGNEINLKQCMCPIHLGGTKVMWKSNKPETNVYATIGDIKG